MKGIIILYVVLSAHCFFVDCSTIKKSSDNNEEYESVGRQLIEEGRTLVHHAVKRFMIILPAIFFKLGIAFTLLILVTLVAVNNGVIGFMLLVVGLSSVLARLQGDRPAVAAVPYVSSIPYHHHHQIWDRSDSDIVDNAQKSNTKLSYGQYSGYLSQNQQYSPQLTTYYAKYGASKL